MATRLNGVVLKWRIQIQRVFYNNIKQETEMDYHIATVRNLPLPWTLKSGGFPCVEVLGPAQHAMVASQSTFSLDRVLATLTQLPCN